MNILDKKLIKMMQSALAKDRTSDDYESSIELLTAQLKDAIAVIDAAKWQLHYHPDYTIEMVLNAVEHYKARWEK